MDKTIYKFNKKCNCTLAFLKRNLSNSPSFVKKQCYTSLIRPKLEYACAVWDPHCSTHIESLEKVQKRAARFVTGNYKMESGAHRNASRPVRMNPNWKRQDYRQD